MEKYKTRGLGFAMFRFSDTKEQFEKNLKEAVEKNGVVREDLEKLQFPILNLNLYENLNNEKVFELAEKKKIFGNKVVIIGNTTGTLYINKRVFNKSLSNKAVGKSYSRQHQITILLNIENVINNSFDVEIHADCVKKNNVRAIENGYNKSILIHRLYTAVNIENDIFRVKTTIKEYKDEAITSRPYTFEITKIELVLESEQSQNGQNSPMKLANSISAAILLKNVEKSYDKGVFLIKNQNNNFSGSKSEISDNNILDGLGSVRTETSPHKTIVAYKLMRLVDSKLYPLYIDRSEPVELGVWYNADSVSRATLESLPFGYHLIDLATDKVIDSRLQIPTLDEVKAATTNGQRWFYIVKQKTKIGFKNVGIAESKGKEQVKADYALRPGWHCASLPVMRQIGKGENRDLRDDSFVWAEIEISADIDYNAEAQANGGELYYLPVNGYYKKCTNANKKAAQADKMDWYIAGAIRINRIISDAEARQIIDRYNRQHNTNIFYDFPRESGKMFNADTMSLEGFGELSIVEKANLIKFLPPISLNEEEHITQKEAETIIENLAVGVNKYDGIKVLWVKNTIGKILRHKGFDTSLLIPKLKIVFDNSVPMLSESELFKDGHKAHPNFKGYHHYVGKIEFESKEYYVRFTLQEINTHRKDIIPNQFHSTYISDIKITNACVNTGTTPATANIGDNYVDTKLVEFFKRAKEMEEKSQSAPLQALIPTYFKNKLNMKNNYINTEMVSENAKPNIHNTKKAEINSANLHQHNAEPSVETLLRRKSSLLGSSNNTFSQIDIDEAKVEKNTQSAKNNLKKYQNGDYKPFDIPLKKLKLESLGRVLLWLRRLFKMIYHGQSSYNYYITPKGLLNFRISNHNANPKNFKANNADFNISVYVALFEHKYPDADVKYTEYRYSRDDYEVHAEEIIEAIIKGFDHALQTGDFVDYSGYAKVLEHKKEGQPTNQSAPLSGTNDTDNKNTTEPHLTQNEQSQIMHELLRGARNKEEAIARVREKHLWQPVAINNDKTKRLRLAKAKAKAARGRLKLMEI